RQLVLVQEIEGFLEVFPGEGVARARRPLGAARFVFGHVRGDGLGRNRRRHTLRSVRDVESFSEEVDVAVPERVEILLPEECDEVVLLRGGETGTVQDGKESLQLVLEAGEEGKAADPVLVELSGEVVP